MTNTEMNTEIFKSRALATAIYSALSSGEVLSLEIMNAYEDLKEFYEQETIQW